MKITDKKKFKKTIIIVLVILVIILLAIGIIRNLSKKYNTIEDFSTVKQVLEYLGCDYIRTENLKNQEYKQNIYVKFNKDLYENESSNERFFDNLVQMVAKVNDYKSTILTDNEKNIVIKIKCNDEKNTFDTYYINDIEDYFAKQSSNNNISNLKEEANTRLSVNSNILNSLINKKWIYNDVNLGTKESEFENYNIYSDEGFKVRIVANKVFNIVFDSNYKDAIVNNITVGTSLEDIKDVLGEPTYEDKSANVIGYRNNDIYIFFSENEISAYRVDNNYDSQFYGLLGKFVNGENDFQTFIDNLTSLWTDYDMHANTDGYYVLTYTLKGINIQVTTENKDGIYLYSNYLGFKNNEDIQKYIDSGKVHVSTDTNLVFDNEVKRISAQKDLEYSYINYMANMEKDKKESAYFYYRVYKYDDGSIYKVGFLSKDDTHIDNELKESMNSYIWYSDDIFLYSKPQDGIYAYDVVNRDTQKLLGGSDDFEIKGIENDRLKYDDKSVLIR